MELLTATNIEERSICSMPLTLVRRTPPKTGPVYDTYWRFAAKRQEVYHKRVAGAPGPWTDDPILQEHRFTNAYRAADRVSQYLIRNVIYAGDFAWSDTVLRVLLFKIFNKIETWELFEATVGQIKASKFSVRAIDQVLSQARAAGASIYSPAYIMPSGPAEIRRDSKHRMHLELLSREMAAGLAEDLANAPTMARAYERLRAIPSFGPFLAYQFATDLNYAQELSFSEMDFVVPGPGARDGLRKCFRDLGDFTEAEAIRWVAERQSEEFERLGLTFRDLWGRPLQLIDCQNLFCEVDKYARVAHPEVPGHSGRTRIKQRFNQAAEPFPQPFFPPKWQLEVPVAFSSAASWKM